MREQCTLFSQTEYLVKYIVGYLESNVKVVNNSILLLNYVTNPSIIFIRQEAFNEISKIKITCEHPIL